MVRQPQYVRARRTGEESPRPAPTGAETTGRGERLLPCGMSDTGGAGPPHGRGVAPTRPDRSKNDGAGGETLALWCASHSRCGPAAPLLKGRPGYPKGSPDGGCGNCRPVSPGPSGDPGKTGRGVRVTRRGPPTGVVALLLEDRFARPPGGSSQSHLSQQKNEKS